MKVSREGKLIILTFIVCLGADVLVQYGYVCISYVVIAAFFTIALLYSLVGAARVKR